MKVKRLLAIILAVVMMIGIIPFAELSVSAASYPTLRKGDKNANVKTLQTILNEVADAGLDVDGSFGGKTQTAVKNFQKANGLKVDGVCGPATWAKLEKLYGKAISTLGIASGNYNPGSLMKGKSYSIDGKITSNFKITSVTVGIYKTNGTATAQVKTVKPDAKSYDIKNVDKYIKFGQVAAGTYDFIVKATDASGTTKTLVNNEFMVKQNPVEAFEEKVLETWVPPVKKSGFWKIENSQRNFASNRESGTRKHAAIDFVYTNGKGTPVYAMQSGKVVGYCSNFYGGMQAIAVQHADGSVARYCEINTSLRKGDKVTQGQQIATVGKSNIGGSTMLHLELYLGTASGKFTNRSNKTFDYVSGTKFERRRDLINPYFLLGLFDNNPT
ncbi:MAG: peptidoglycan-binding protein [Ruminococcus sp.]|nr:peptidoglycan-binding protein [Ruminococcus sp.]